MPAKGSGPVPLEAKQHTQRDELDDHNDDATEIPARDT